MDTVIVYDTNYGTSEKVAQILGEQICGAVELVNVKDIEIVDLDDVDRLIIGCGIKAGKITKRLKSWMDKNESKILDKNIYIYICALENVEEKIENLIKSNFSNQILEKSLFSTCVGGEIDLDRVNIIMKILVRIISRTGVNFNTLDYEKIHRIAQEINEVKVK